LVSACVFLAVASPFITALSRSKGRLTFGDVGSVNYAAYINGVDFLFPGDGGKMTVKGGPVVEGVDTPSPFSSKLRHPARRIFDTPQAYEFGGPVGGTYPFWYDPSYWQEGIEPHFDLEGEVQAMTRAARLYRWLLLNPFRQLNFTVGLAILFLTGLRPWRFFKRAATNWCLLIPALAGVGLYLVVYTEPR
jgi:hypothetical protein